MTANRGRARPDLKGKPGVGRPKGTGKPFPDPHALPTAMRVIRLDAGLTLADAAAVIGLTGSHLGKIETGASALYAADAVKLARAYGVSVEELVGSPSEWVKSHNSTFA